MATSKSDLLQGTLDLLILRTLSLGPLHGYGISQRLEQLTRGVFHVNAGTFFPPSTGWRSRACSPPGGDAPRTTAGRASTR